MAHTTISRRAMLGGVAALFSAAPRSMARASEQQLQRLRQGGLLVFMRHANAPGVGDPPGFRIDDCRTQRNLSEQGRRQATALGERLRQEGVRWTSVQSSRWCRCLDTARLAFGAVEPFDLLNSSFAGRPDATPELRAHLLALPRSSDGNRIYVTHMVNVMALLNVNTADAEMVLARVENGALETLGTLRPPA